jgi:hypothetical protein
VVDRAALEMRSTGNRTGGSNPSLSAIKRANYLEIARFLLIKSAYALSRALAAEGAINAANGDALS